MRMENYTPFPNLRFFNSDCQGREFGVLLVKGTYVIQSDGRLSITGDQEPLVLSDAYHGTLNTSSLLMPSDLVPYKPKSDVILNAVARAPGGRAHRSWTCGVRVEGRHVLEKRLRVTGPRHWRAAWRLPDKFRAIAGEKDIDILFKGWTLGEPEPVTEVPLQYEFAYGGMQPRPRDGADEPFYEADERNPIGRGWIDGETTSRESPVPAPQIEDLAEPIADPHRRYAPQGVGPIPPAWLPRRLHGGTYDDHWREHVWPSWPADYDFAYHNSAAAGLVYPGFLMGNETIRLSGFDGGATETVLQLPGQAIVAVLERKRDKPLVARMRLDTLFLDIADLDISKHKVLLSWRVCFELDDLERLSFVLVSLDVPAPSAASQQGDVAA